MLARLATVIVVLLIVAACGGAAASAMAPTAPAGSSTAPIATGALAPARVDLSGVDACSLVDAATLQALTGEPEFITMQSDNTHCFWHVDRAGVPQYLEIRMDARPNGLSGYSWNIPGTCTSGVVAGAGVEAFGGTCSAPQDKVFLMAWDRGVAVQILVNEPVGGLTPDGLAAIANSVLDGLAIP